MDKELGGNPNYTYAAVTVGSAATAVYAANPALRIIHFVNTGAATVYLGDSNVTAASGYPLVAGAAKSFASGRVQGWYGIVATGTDSLNYLAETT